jgi:hypothetical protein
VGFTVNADIETSQGATQELYVRIESIVVNRVSGKVSFQVTYWIDKDHAIASSKQFAEDEEQQYTGLISNRVLYFNNTDSESVELLLPPMIKEDLSEDKEVEVPVFSTMEESKEIPYTSFDSNGDEITLYKTVTSYKNVKVGTKLESRKVINPALASDIYKLGYTSVYNTLQAYFPADNIKEN